LEPGTYAAFEQWQDWYHVKTVRGELWICPKQALVKRPVGIVSTEEEIELTKDTSTFDYPDRHYPAHLKEFYSPQKVKAFEKWTSREGDVWYRIHGFGLDEWVPAPDSPFMRPKSFRELYPGNLERVSRIVISRSTSNESELRTVDDVKWIADWIGQTADLKFQAYAEQIKRIGFQYRIQLYEGDRLMMDLTTWNINGIDYEPVPALIQPINELFQLNVHQE
jgi:hypothetical protein